MFWFSFASYLKGLISSWHSRIHKLCSWITMNWMTEILHRSNVIRFFFHFILLLRGCKEDPENKHVQMCPLTLYHWLFTGVRGGFTNKVKVNKEAGHCHMIPHHRKHTLHQGFPHSGLSHRAGSMRAWPILLFALLALTFAEEGK